MKTSRLLYSIIFIIAFTSHLSAQKRQEAVDYKSKAEEYKIAEDYVNFVLALDSAFLAEFELEDPDTLFLAEIAGEAALYYEAFGWYNIAIGHYEYSMRLFRKAGNMEKAREMLKLLTSAHQDVKTNDVEVELTTLRSVSSTNVYFRIDTVLRQNYDSVWVVLSSGSNDGIFAGSKGDVKGIYLEEYENRGNLSLGKAEVLEVFPNKANVLINLIDPTNPKTNVFAGDMVTLPALIHESENPSIFYELALLNIDFLDIYSDPLYYPRHLFYYDGEAVEEVMLAMMKDDILETAEMIKPTLDENPQWQHMSESGRFNGLSMLEAMEKSSPEDIKAFLYFIQCFPGKYMGHTWKINETYATWIINDCPVSDRELKQLLLDAPNDSSFISTLLLYKDDFYDGSFYYEWFEEAEDLSGKGYFEEAEVLVNLLSKVSEVLNDSTYKAWAQYSSAYMDNQKQEYELSLEKYNTAYEMFKNLNIINGQFYSLHNIAHIHNSRGEYVTSLDIFEESLTLKLQALEEDPTSHLKESIGGTYEGIAISFYNLSRYKEATEYFQDGIKYYRDANTLSGVDGQTDLLGWLGKINYTTGNYDTALVYYERQLKLYTELGNQNGAADAFDNLAYTNSLKGNTKKANEQYRKAYELKIKTDDKDGAGFSMSNVGQTYWTLGEYDSAIVSHNKAIELREEANNRKGQAYSWSKLGDLYKESGDPKKALEAFDRSISLYEEVGDKKATAEITNNLGNTYFNGKDYYKAIEYYSKAETIYREIEARIDLATVLTDIGFAYYKVKRFDEASTHYFESLEVQKEIDDKSGQFYNYINLGGIQHHNKYNFDKAEEYYNEAFRIATEINSKSLIAYSYRIFGYLNLSRGNIEETLIQHNKALSIYSEIEEIGSVAEINIDLGYDYTNQGSFDEAEKYFDEAKKIAEAINNRDLISQALSGKGQLKRMTGEFHASLDLINESLKVSQEVDNSWNISGIYLNFGNTYNAMGEYKTAINYYYLTDSILQIVGNEYSRATPINNIGTIYYWQKDYERAMKQFEEAHTILDIPGNNSEFMSILKVNIGEIYLEYKDYDNAEIWINEGLRIAREGKIDPRIASTLLTKGKLFTELKRFDETEVCFIEAKEIIERIDQKESMIELNFYYGKMYFEMEQFQLAVEKLQKSIDVSKEISSDKYIWGSMYYLAIAEDKLGEIEKSIETLEEAVGVLELISTKVSGGEEAKKTFEQDEMRLNVFEKIIELLIDQNRIEDALDYLDRANNDNMKSKFGNMDVQFADESKNDALKAEKDLKNKLDQLNEELAKEKSKPEGQQSANLIKKLEDIQTVTEKEYMSFINTTIQNYPDLMNYFSSSVNPKEFRAAKRNIPDDMATLLYLIGADKLYIFVATKDSVYARVVDVDIQELENDIHDMHALLTRPSFISSDTIELRGAATLAFSDDVPDNEDVFKMLSEKLYNLLVGPVIDEVSDKEKLVIIPNGMLYYLPYQVLGYSDENGHLNYMIEDYEILYTNKLRFGFAVSETKQFNIVALGNADNSLPFAETEVNEIKNIFPDAKVYVREEATRDKVINIPEDYNILHLATHGVLDYNNFENSYLVLAANPDANDDGRLKIEDIYQIQNLDLYNIVTLSACETAVNFEMIEGWPVTTASAFLDLGVVTVIASLWSVDDEATNILMKKFYENLKSLDKLSALNQAQLELVNNPKYSHPFYWAPFLFIGDWR